jgi:hypothetical protein
LNRVANKGGFQIIAPPHVGKGAGMPNLMVSRDRFVAKIGSQMVNEPAPVFQVLRLRLPVQRPKPADFRSRYLEDVTSFPKQKTVNLRQIRQSHSAISLSTCRRIK